MKAQGAHQSQDVADEAAAVTAAIAAVNLRALIASAVRVTFNTVDAAACEVKTVPATVAAALRAFDAWYIGGGIKIDRVNVKRVKITTRVGWYVCEVGS